MEGYSAVDHSCIACPVCGADARHLETYNIGSGPELPVTHEDIRQASGHGR